jgi:hypothetical protein
VTYFLQPSSPLELGGKRCRLQILDPETTFEIEPDLETRFGSKLVLLLAAPKAMIEAIGGVASTIYGIDGTLSDAMHDPEHGEHACEEALALFSRLFTEGLLAADLDGRWLAKTFQRMVFGRLTVEGETVESWADWRQHGLRPFDRWYALAFQISQTYKPLWLRSPYNLRPQGTKDYGVPKPRTPKAVQWAAMLTQQGYAASPHEVLTQWTPSRLIDVVETAAYMAETERRAVLAAKERR